MTGSAFAPPPSSYLMSKTFRLARVNGEITQMVIMIDLVYTIRALIKLMVLLIWKFEVERKKSEEKSSFTSIRKEKLVQL